MSTYDRLGKHLSSVMITTGHKLEEHMTPTDMQIVVEAVIDFFNNNTRPWITMDHAPDTRCYRSILVVHDDTSAASDPEHPYHEHRRVGLSSPRQGIFIAVWGGDCWFERDSDYGQPLYPIKWMPMPDAELQNA